MDATHTLAGDAPASSSAPFSTLPVALLARVLQHVPQQQRLASSALVSREWAAAAAASTLRVEGTDIDNNKFESVSAWIQKYGRQLESMQLQPSCPTHYHWQWSVDRPKLQLPCHKLQQLSVLQLTGLEVQLLPLPSCSTPSAYMPQLQALHLEHCKFKDAASLLQLGPFTAVTRLALNSVCFVHEGPGTAAAKPGTLGAMAALSLTLAAMTQLQEVWLAEPARSRQQNDALLAALPPSIQTLHLDTFGHKYPMGQPKQHLPPSHLQQLRELKLWFGVFCPAALANLSQLLVLELRGCTVLAASAEDPEGAAAVLSAVGCMRQLRHLAFDDEEVHGTSFAAAPPSSCSALTASSHLTSLEVCTLYSLPVPKGALQYMFPARRMLPQLQNLSLSCECPHTIAYGVTPFMTGAELSALVSACPALTSLDIVGALQPGEGCSALLQLPPTCRKLSVGGEAFGDSAAATVVQLTQLTYLGWIGSCTLTDGGLYQLTALQGLQELFLTDDHNLIGELVDKEDDFMQDDLRFAAGAQHVWQQLEGKIRACPSNATWAAQLGRKQQQIEHLQQEIQRLQRCCAAPTEPAAVKLG